MKRFCILLALLLTACSGGSIDAVKQSRLEANQTLTVGQAFDAFPLFASREWKVFDAEGGQKLVQCESVLANQDVFSRTRLADGAGPVETYVDRVQYLVQFIYDPKEKKTTPRFSGITVQYKNNILPETRLFDMPYNLLEDILQKNAEQFHADSGLAMYIANDIRAYLEHRKQ